MRILIVKVSSLGDIIHTLPAVTDARRAHRELTVDWVVEENFAEVPAWHPAVDTVIPVAIRRWRKTPFSAATRAEFQSFRQTLRGRHYDLIIDAQGLLKSALISRLARPAWREGKRIGFSRQSIREPLATLFYDRVYAVSRDEHAVTRLRQLFSSALGHQHNPELVDYGLDPARFSHGDKPPADKQAIGDGDNPPADGQQIDHTDDPPAESQQKTVVFLHGTTWTTKHWPENYWKRLAEIARDAGFEVLLPWGNQAEKQRAEFIAGGNPAAQVLAKQSLSELANTLNLAGGVIAVDTGLGHLAAALARPTISLYGATDPGLSGTFGQNQLHLKSQLDCAPCVKRTCAYTGPTIPDEYAGQSFAVTPPCFASHTPEQVWQQFEKLLRG